MKNSSSFKKTKKFRISHCGTAEVNPVMNYEVAGLNPGLAQWVKDLALPLAVVYVTDMAQSRHCCGCDMAGAYSSDSAPSLGTSMCCECGPKKQKKKKKEIVTNTQWVWLYKGRLTIHNSIQKDIP